MLDKKRTRIEKTRTSMQQTVLLVLIISSVFGFFTPVLAEISVAPTRIVLDPENRVARITLRNDGHSPQLVSPNWTQLVQAADASLHPTGFSLDPGQMTDVGIWPMNARLAPGKQVEFQLLLDPGAQQTGETRHHLRFNLDPEQGKGPRWGVVIPVFVRGNIPLPDVQLLDAIQTGPETLDIALHNRGGASPHGHLVAFDRMGQKIAELHNVNVFSHNVRISFSMQIAKVPRGPIRVQYMGNDEFSGLVFAQADFDLIPGPTP